MELREKLNSKEGFQELLKKKLEHLSENKERILSFLNDEQIGIQRKSKPNMEIVKSYRSGIILDYEKIITILYSLGYEIKEIQQYFIELLGVFEELRKMQSIEEFKYGREPEPYYGTDEYWRLLTLVSLGILLEVSDEDFQRIIKIRNKVDTPDILLNFLINRGQTTSNQLRGNKYTKLAQLIQNSNSINFIEELKSYLSKDWFKEYKNMGWAESHKSKKNIHNGYWSFESGALVKILGLDDSSLKDQQYYLYDMVHWAK